MTQSMRYIYCHPLFDEQKCAYRFSYFLAKAFQKNGLRLERFDYRGTGESEHRFCDVTINSLQNDLCKKVAGDKVSLIGTRFGSSIAFTICCIYEIRGLVLIEPIVRGCKYLDYLFRKQRLKDMITGNTDCLPKNESFCNLEGYKTSVKFIEQIKQLNLLEKSRMLKTRSVFIVQISGDSTIKPEYELFAKKLRKNGITVYVESFNLPEFWERIPDGDYSAVFRKIREFCR